MSRYSWDECSEVTELIGSVHGMMLRHDKSDFEMDTYLPFEGHPLPVMSGYRKYLERIWGDYMQLPPVEKRKNHFPYRLKFPGDEQILSGEDTGS